MSKVIFEMLNATMDVRMALRYSIGWNIGYKYAVMLGRESARQIINKFRD